MIDVNNSVEVLHRKLESRSELTEKELFLNGSNHVVYLPSNENFDEEDETYLLQRASSLRWVLGSGELTIQEHAKAQEVLDESFVEGGALAFEHKLFKNLKLEGNVADNIEGGGSHSLFIDMGGSSIKGVLFNNGQLARQHSFAWKPFEFSEMSQLTSLLKEFLIDLLSDRNAADVNYVGVCSAGLCRNGALLASTLTQGMKFSKGSPYDPWFLKKMIMALFPKASTQLYNDGEVTALPFQKKATEKRVISLVMGSNLGGGYYPERLVEGVHEIGFLPVLVESEYRDSWSGYSGIASEVFSKKGLLRLAKQHGYPITDHHSERDVIDRLHTDLRHGLVKARLIFQALGKILAPFVSYLQRFYTIDTVLLSGGILTEKVVDEMRGQYQTTYSSITNRDAPPIQMLVVPGVLPEYNQVWSMALHYFNHQK